MKDHGFLLFLAVAILLTSAPPAAAQASSGGVLAHMVVTVEARHGTEVPEITRQDVMVYQDRDRDRVIEWTSLQGDHDGLELFVAIDELDTQSRFATGGSSPVHQLTAGERLDRCRVHAERHRRHLAELDVAVLSRTPAAATPRLACATRPPLAALTVPATAGILGPSGPGPTADLRRPPGRTALAPRLAACYKIAMAITMGYMLILML